MTISRKMVACAFILYGALMALAPSGIYSSGSYYVAFQTARDLSPGDIAPTTVWGVAFVVAGHLGMLLNGGRARQRPRHDLGVPIMAALLAAWTVGLALASFLHDEQGNPRAQTWGGPIWPALVVGLILVNIGRDHR